MARDENPNKVAKQRRVRKQVDFTSEAKWNRHGLRADTKGVERIREYTIRKILKNWSLWNFFIVYWGKKFNPPHHYVPPRPRRGIKLRQGTDNSPPWGSAAQPEGGIFPDNLFFSDTPFGTSCHPPSQNATVDRSAFASPLGQNFKPRYAYVPIYILNKFW